MKVLFIIQGEGRGHRLTCIGACRRFALSFRPMDDSPSSRIRVIPPLLRPEVLACESEKGDYHMSGCRAYATTAGFESVCEAMYLGKPLLMVPAHIEQDCNAYDAALTGAGIVADSFDLQRLLDFEQGYRPNAEFRYWVRSAERIILDALEEVVHSGRFPLGVPYEYCNRFEI